MKRTRKKVFVGGSCRSGTATITELLRSCGLRVGHEQMGEDGTVSGFFPYDVLNYPHTRSGKKLHDGDGRLADYDFDATIHLIRHPLLAIASQTRALPARVSRWYRANALLPARAFRPSRRPALLICAWQWHTVNVAMRRLRPSATLRLEKIREDWRAVSEAIFGEERELPSVPHEHGHRPDYVKPVVSWRDLMEVDSEVYDRIKLLASNYGYEE